MPNPPLNPQPVDPEPPDTAAAGAEPSAATGGQDTKRPTRGCRAQRGGRGVSAQLIRMTDQHYTLGCTPEGDPFALPRTGPLIVRLLRGGQGSLRSELAAAHFARTGSPASATALADACLVLDGQAQRLPRTPLHLRVARAPDGALVLDLGDPTGRAVVITRHLWKLVDDPPVLFRRTVLTGPLPEPVGGHGFTGLWDALNVAPQYRPLVLAVLVAALIPTMPHPIVLLTGEHGTGKSTATARLASVIDPSPVQLRKTPRDPEAWTTAAAGSWVVALDNLSAVSEWLSDALCRATTGDGDVRRRLYSDDDLHVIAFRRVLLLNGIDVGGLRADLADRLVHLGLDPIPDTDRLTEQQMTHHWVKAHPTVLGALLDLTVQVLAVLPTMHLPALPRMADFARVLAAVDTVCATTGLSTYLGLRDELAQDAASSDPVLLALAEHITTPFEGTAHTLLTTITPPPDDNGFRCKPPKNWPTHPRALTATLTRHAPILRHLGWTVENKGRTADPRGKSAIWTLTPPPTPTTQPTSHPVDKDEA